MVHKKWIAAALCLPVVLPVSAWAQSSVQVSGFLDMGIYRDSDKATKLGPIQRSNIQFTGKEDLGNGLAVTFKLSHRFDTSTGANESSTKPFWHGESTVGLQGGFGSLQLGRRLDAVWANDWNYDPWGNFNSIASPAWDMWHYGVPSDIHANSGTPDYGRLNNGIFYDSPTFGGFTLHLSGSPERVNPATDKRPYSAAVQYKNAHVSAMYGHGRNNAGSRDNFWGINGKLGNFNLMGAYDRSKFDGNQARAITVGATYQLNQWQLRTGAGRVKVNGVEVQKMYAAGAQYNLSKRTSVYFDVARKIYPTSKVNTFGGGIAHAF